MSLNDEVNYPNAPLNSYYKYSGENLDARINKVLAQIHDKKILLALLDQKRVPYDNFQRPALLSDAPVSDRLRDFKRNRAVLLEILILRG